MTPGEADPAKVTAVLVGNRRSYQIVRHLEDDAEGETDGILNALSSPVEWIAIERSFRLTRSQLPGWTDDDELVRELDELLKKSKGEFGEMRTWLLASAYYTLEALKETWPSEEQRRSFYANGAAAAFNAEEPGSFMRRKAFGQTDDRT